MIFTQEQIQEIYNRLGRLGIKDTDLPPVYEVDGNETIAIVQDSVNKKIPLSLIFDSPAFESYYRLLIDTINEKQKELIAIADEVREKKISLSDKFGDGETVGITQKVLTQSFNKIWSKLEQITGESLKGFSLIVTPEYYIGEDGCTVHISASSAETAGRFEYIKFYINNILVTEAEDVESFEYTTTVNETCEIKCVAKILGIEYTETKMLTHYSSFFLGASTSYTNIMNVTHVISINNGMKGNYSVPCNDGDHIYVVIGKSLRDSFTRTDMNGVEIQFNETEVTVGGKEYVVFTSNGTIERGTYNIDINS